METLNFLVYALYAVTAFFMLYQLFENGRELKESSIKTDQNERILIQNQNTILSELSDLKHIATQSKAQNEIFLKEVRKLKETQESLAEKHELILERVERIEIRITNLEKKN